MVCVLQQECMYLHDYGDEAASFSKEEIQQGYLHICNLDIIVTFIFYVQSLMDSLQCCVSGFCWCKGTGIVSMVQSPLGCQANWENSHRHNPADPSFMLYAMPILLQPFQFIRTWD